MAPRNEKRPAVLWVIPLLTTVPFLIGIGVCYYHWALDLEIDKRAETTVGVITEIEYKNHHQYDFEYSVGGVGYTGGQVIAGNLNPEKGIGDQVTVRYDPMSPSKSSLTAFGYIDGRPVPIFLLLVGALLAGLRMRQFLRRQFEPPS